MALLCRTATEHDLVAIHQLFSMPGWQTLEAIVESTGETIPESHSNKRKRPRQPSGDGAVDGAGAPIPTFSSSSVTGRSATGEPIAKRLAGLRLNGARKDDKSRPRPAPPPDTDK